MGGLEHPCRLLTERRRQRSLVEDGVGRPVLGVSDLVAELDLPLGGDPQRIGHVVQKGPDLAGVESTAYRAERVAGHFVGRQARR